jgi:hypothetical protein
MHDLWHENHVWCKKIRIWWIQNLALSNLSTGNKRCISERRYFYQNPYPDIWGMLTFGLKILRDWWQSVSGKDLVSRRLDHTSYNFNKGNPTICFQSIWELITDTSSCQYLLLYFVIYLLRKQYSVLPQLSPFEISHWHYFRMHRMDF